MRFTDATGRLLSEEILPVFIDIQGRVRQLNPKQIVNFSDTPERLLPSNQSVQNIIEKSDEFLDKTKDFVIQEAKTYSKRVQRRKDREISIKREDTRRYFEIKIKEEKKRISEYQMDLFKGKDMEIAIRAGQRRLRDLNTQYKKVMDRLEEEGLVIEEMPELISCAIILPE